MLLTAARSMAGFLVFFQFKKTTRIHRTSHINDMKWVHTLLSTQLGPQDYDFSKNRGGKKAEQRNKKSRTPEKHGYGVLIPISHLTVRP